MRNLFKAIALLAVAAVCAGFAACSDDNGEEPATKEKPVAIGIYTFDGVEHDICYGEYVIDGSFYCFRFTPTAKGEPQHTEIVLWLSDTYEGRTIDVSRYYATMDYVFWYDDPFYYFAPEYALKGGSILVQDNGDGNFIIKMDDIVLHGPEENRFSLSFEGTLPNHYDMEE